jgi:hypothetical protein
MEKEIEIKNKKITKENVLKLWDKFYELKKTEPEETKNLTLRFKTDGGDIYNENDKSFETIIDCKKCESILMNFFPIMEC